MRQTIQFVVICFLIGHAGIATAMRDPHPTGVEIELSFSPTGGCRATLTRSIGKAPFWKRNARIFTLPQTRRQLLDALKKSGRDRYSADIHAKLAVPKACSGYAIEASRLAAFSKIAFKLPINPDDGRPAEHKSVCEVLTDPVRFRGERIELRGSTLTFMTPDAINVYLREADCGQGAIRLIAVDQSALQLNDDPLHPVEMIVTGTPGSASCFYNPPGSQCGTYFMVESFRKVDQPVR